MSSKEIRAALKAAKTAIQAKDYDTALQHCEVIFNKDAENYNALVFSGLCFSETNRADNAREKYRIAIKVQPDQILAFQGLANLYTKHWNKPKSKDEATEFAMVCEKILSSSDRKDSKKHQEAFVNHCNALLECDNAIIVVENISSELKHIDDMDFKIVLYSLLFKAMKNEKDLKIFLNFSEVITEAFQSLVNTEPSNQEKILSYLEVYLIFIKGNSELLLKETSNILNICLSLIPKFPSLCLLLEIISEALIQEFDCSCIEDFDTIQSKLVESASNYAGIFDGYLALKSSHFEKAFTYLSTSLPACSNFLPGWILLCDLSLRLHRYSEAKTFARKALGEYKGILSGTKSTWILPITSLEEAKFHLTKCLAVGLCNSHVPDDILKGIVTLEKLIDLRPDNASLYVYTAEGCIGVEKYEKASELLQKAIDLDQSNGDAEALLAYLVVKAGSHDEGIAKLQSLPATGRNLYLLGKSMWEANGQYRKDKKNCFTALVKAAKLDPNRGETFFLLGHFYSEVQRDKVRAKGCYQKAYDLDQQHQEAAACLADSYMDDGEIELAIALYEKITKEYGSAGGKWAWLRLGLYKLKAKDMSNAIQCFQVALRIDGDDSICWECLGEGYLQRGSYTAAWKAFDRARHLNPKSVYSLYQIARVKQVQGLFTEAIQEYESTLTISPGYVPALRGLGESELLLARQLFQEGRFHTGLYHLEKSIDRLVSACQLRKDLCCLWKLLGDGCMLVHSLHDSAVRVGIPSILLGKTDSSERSIVGKMELLSLGVRFYSRSAELMPENASLWHDLGVSLFRVAENSKIEDELISYSKKAISSLKKAITLEPKNHTFWCNLGVVAASKSIKDSSLAQHCFLKSIKCEQNNVQAWSNLATLYLENDHVKLAHEAFKVAQSLEPSFTKSWIGQALIADAIGSEETMDLYRHSTELGLQKQGAAGYCTWVAKIMSDASNRDSIVFKENIRNMNAVNTAITQIGKSCLRNPRCPWSSTMYGFFLEYSGLMLSAEDAYRSAFNVLSENSSDENILDKINITARNLARILCKNGKYDEACSIYNSHTESLGFYDCCTLGLCNFKVGRYDKALEIYQEAGTKTSSENEKAQVMVCLAMVYWKMGKNNESKTMLYQCFQKSKPGLQALLALGLSFRDNALIGAAVGEILKSTENHDEKEMYDDCRLISAAAKVYGDPKVGLNEIQKSIKKNPSSPLLRNLLCRFLIEFNSSHSLLSVPQISDIACKLLEKSCQSQPLHQDSELWKASLYHCTGLKVSKTRAVSALAAGSLKSSESIGLHAKERLRQAQRYAHMHPYEASSWSILACACHAQHVSEWFEGRQRKETELMVTLTGIPKQISNDDDDTKIWCDEILCWSKALTGGDVKNYHNPSPNAKLSNLLITGSRTNDKAKLQSILKEITGIMGATSHPDRSSKYFAEFLEQRKMFQVSRRMFEKSISLSGTDNLQKFTLNVRLLLLLYKVNCVDKTKAKGDESPLKTVLSEMLNFDQRSPLSLLFQGLASRIDGNHRKARSFFNRVINTTELIPDSLRSVAVWYLYRTLHERSDWTEIEKLTQTTLDLKIDVVPKIMEILPPIS